MVGVYSIGESGKGFDSERVTSSFLRLEKEIRGGNFDVYEFCKANNGNMFIEHHEENAGEGKRILGYIHKTTKLGKTDAGKEYGNKKYKELMEEGYIFTGVYECDMCGYAKRVR